ncbi:MAG: YHS domain-containing (seleno)protein [Alkalilacustris sp.]
MMAESHHPWHAARPRTVRTALAALFGLIWAVLGSQPVMAGGHDRIAAQGGVALHGFDPVAYFTVGAALPGDPDIALRWRGLRWHFASPAHRTAFEANPKAYLPEFGGHCPVSVAHGAPRPADPRHWAIIEGRLYIAAEPGALNRFLAQADGLRQQARVHWGNGAQLAGSD